MMDALFALVVLLDIVFMIVAVNLIIEHKEELLVMASVLFLLANNIVLAGFIIFAE